MNRLTTQGSRETSPLAPVMRSEESTPLAMVDSPSPRQAADLSKLPSGRGPALSPSWASPYMALHPSAKQPPNQAQVPMHAAPPPGYPGQFPSGPLPCTLKIHDTPVKSRVETQITIRMTISSLPKGVKRLHLPKHAISKPKLLAKPPPQRSHDMLELSTMLVCSSAMQKSDVCERVCARARMIAQGYSVHPPAEKKEKRPQDGDEVKICNGCITRERKRADRKKNKKPGDVQIWTRDEGERVVVFNSHEIKEWQPTSGPEFEIEVPMRIACYCRHHGEKVGFRVVFTMTDHHGNLVAQTLSNSIMITDDHKTHSPPMTVAGSSANGPEQPAPAFDSNSLDPSFRPSQSTSDLQMLRRNNSGAPSPPDFMAGLSQTAAAPRPLSRPASPTGGDGPYCKKRKASGPAKVPRGLAMTRLETTPQVTPLAQPTHNAVSTATSPFSPNRPSFSPQADAMFQPVPYLPAGMPQYPSVSPPHNGNDPVVSGGLDGFGLVQPQIYSAPTSSHPSRVPSPNGLRQTPPTLQEQRNLFEALAGNVLAPTISNAPPRPAPVIHKIIPAVGPKSGGIEVTILGQSFRSGMEVMFGSHRATTTTYWGESSLVCLLPPAVEAGPVMVTLEPQNELPPMQASARFFTYQNDDEQQLMRTALTVVGHKMNGNVEDVGDLARRIIQNRNSLQWNPSPSDGSQGQGGSQYTGHEMSLETTLLKILELIDIDDSPYKPRLNLRRTTGQTMLHLACSLGLNRFVAGLLGRKVHADLRDKGGYTPLHLAALNNHPEIVRRLISYGVDPTIRTLSGLTAADVARSPEVIEAIRLCERHARSRSSASIHSRVSSVTSLKSMWEPSSTAAAGQARTEECEAAEESPEYSSGDMASEQEPDTDDEPWLDMRRRSTPGISHDDKSNPRIQTQQQDVPGALGSPTAAVSAFKEQFATQFQQLQQTMAMQLQNLPQFPYLPQMPHMPPLAEYQVYLNSAAVLQRLTAMVPNIGVARPGSAGGQPGNRDMDGKWWDISSLMPSAAPPPAYEEIFPRGDLDKKQASAAQAAAEAEADHKCATLYDQQCVSAEAAAREQSKTATSSTREQSTSTSATEEEIMTASTPDARYHKLPTLLQIGRKNAITKEQQENLRRAHAEKLKRLSRDRNLFFIWVSSRSSGIAIPAFSALCTRTRILISIVYRFPSSLSSSAL